MVKRSGIPHWRNSSCGLTLIQVRYHYPADGSYTAQIVVPRNWSGTAKKSRPTQYYICRRTCGMAPMLVVRSLAVQQALLCWLGLGQHRVMVIRCDTYSQLSEQPQPIHRPWRYCNKKKRLINICKVHHLTLQQTVKRHLITVPSSDCLLMRPRVGC